jgi:hypothetical protein
MLRLISNRAKTGRLDAALRFSYFIILVTALVTGGKTSPARAAKPVPAYLANALKQWKIEPTEKGIREFLKELHPNSVRNRKAIQFVQQLGSNKFREREFATQQLLLTPHLPIESLQKAAKGDDAEARWRAKKILSHRGIESESLLHTVFQTVEAGEIQGLLPELFTVIPQCSQRYLKLAARKAIVATARLDDLPQLKIKAREKNPEVQASAIAALAKLLGKQMEPELATILTNPQAEDLVVLVAARTFANQGDRRFIPASTRLLSSSDVWVRSHAVTLLRLSTGQHFGYAAYDNKEKRTNSIQQWKLWVAKAGKTVKLKSPLPPEGWGGSSLGGNLLLAYGYKNKVIEFDPTGKEVWSFDVKGAWSAEKLANGNVLIAGYYEKKVFEVNREKKTVWEYSVDRSLNAKALRNGNILIAVASGRKVLEISRDKRIVWQHVTKGNCRDIHRLRNGNTLIAAGNVVEEITPDKKQIWSYHASQPYGIQPLQNGNILIADWSGRVIEVTREKKIVWEYKISRPGDAFRLPNGNTLITTDTQFVEVTSGKVIVWKKVGCRYGTARR